MGNAKGDRRERELTNELDDREWAVIRVPASGGATQRELPDIQAGQHGRSVAFEAKSSGGDPIYLTKEEVDALKSYAFDFGAEAKIAIRFDREDWAFFEPGELYRTDAGSYRVKKEDIEGAPGLDDLFGPPVIHCSECDEIMPFATKDTFDGPDDAVCLSCDPDKIYEETAGELGGEQSS